MSVGENITAVAKPECIADNQPEESDIAVNESGRSFWSRGQTLSPLSSKPPREGSLQMPFRALCVLSLNLCGRNTSPVEFELKGDSSETAVEVMAVLRRAEKALTDTKDSPLALLASERNLIGMILDEIYGAVACESHQMVLKLLWSATWGETYSYVQANSPHLFNAFNLPTLLLKRPAVWEDPASCSLFHNSIDYLTAWLEWYRGLDRQGDFWLNEAPRIAKKKNLEVATGFAGVLLFDVMSLFIARRALTLDGTETAQEGESREIPFEKVLKFAGHLPATSFKARHTAAHDLLEATGAHALLAQEARNFAAHVSTSKDFCPPFCSMDGFTAVFLRKNSFAEATDIVSDVTKKLQGLPDVEERLQSAWQTMAKRLAAVFCKCHPHVGGFRVCFVSVHCSKSDGTADFLAALRDVLADYAADLNVVGLVTACGGKETYEFRHRLLSSGFDIGCHAHQDQVTVVKQRTRFQTQVLKAGECDVSHKDYILSWGPMKAKRGVTIYTPNLRTAYGVEQETKQCVRLPTIRWPFDHCGVLTYFQPRRSRLAQALCSLRGLAMCALTAVVVVALLLPLASPERDSPYGPPGRWYRTGMQCVDRAGVCEAAALPCPEDWTPYRGSCYRMTPQLPHNEAEGFCQRFQGHLVTISSEDENQFVADSMCPPGEFCWIGLRGPSTDDGDLWWSSGEPVNYTQLAGIQAGEVFPLYPLPRQREEKLTVLSSLPGEVTGCNPKFLLVLYDDNPESLWALLAGPALAMVVSAVLLARPRPFAWRTVLYLTLAFCVNLFWYLLPAFGACFASDDAGLALSLSLFPRVSEFGHIFTASMAFCLILRRMICLYPARELTIAFVMLLSCSAVYVGLLFLVRDALAVVSTVRPLGLLFLALMGAIVVMHLLLAALAIPELYGSWSCMMREATAGVSAERGSTLHHALRSARIHFFAILAAIGGGVLHWSVTLAAVVSLAQPTFPMWAMHALLVCNVVSSAANDLCAHLMAVLKFDEAVVWSKDINREVANRERVEVQEHQLAVKVLKAAPTSKEQLRKLATMEKSSRRDLESGDEELFWLLQLEVQAESARIHRLMHCVRVRFMTMPMRYQYLINIPCVRGPPRQHVPAEFALGPQSDEAANAYLDWLYAESDGAQHVLFHTVRQLLDKFNSTPWPSDLGLVREEFPWTIWATGPRRRKVRPLQHAQPVSPGDILLYSPQRTPCERLLGRNPGIHCVVLEEHTNCVQIHRGGVRPEEVERDSLRTCSGGGVFVPGPKKKRQRCIDKITADYGESEPWPPAASVCDLCRCMILMPDPYAIAVLVAYIQKQMRVVRVKNRFSEDVLESVGPEELQAMFHNASSQAKAEGSPDTASHDGDRQYRDVALNVEIVGPKGVPFICEIQVTLSNLAILKHAEQKLYTIRRMQSPQELRTTCVFSEAL